MQRDFLTFHLTLANPRSYSFKETDAFSQEFIHSLGLKVHSGCWSNIPLDSPAVNDFIAKASSLISEGKAQFFGLNTLCQNLIEGCESPIEWYQIIGHTHFEVDTVDKEGIETCKAYKMPPTVNVASGNLYNQFVSERFKKVVEDNGFAEIDFVWVKDRGKYKSPQWYRAVALNPMGRGIDHPWFDPAKLRGSGSWQPTDPTWRTGVWNFARSQMKMAVEFENPVQRRVIELYQWHDLTIHSYRRFLRAYLPTVDFAFMWKEENRETATGFLKGRDLCCNRRVRSALLDSKVLTDRDFEPICILDDLPKDSVLLDGRAELPQPFFTHDHLRMIKIKLDKEWQIHSSTEKPIRSVSMKEALTLLRKSKRDRPDDFTKGATEARLKTLDVIMPHNWIQLLRFSNGCYLDPECTLASTEEIMPMYHKKKSLISSTFDDYPYDVLHIPVAYSSNGDWFSLQHNSSKTEDSRVFRISHEDLSVLYTWDSIPVFIHDILSGFYE
jgi:hypothetical protein